MRRERTGMRAAIATVLIASGCVGVSAAQAAPTTWSVTFPPMPLTPNADPNGISCVTSSWCMSVGTNVGSNGVLHTLAQRWTGDTWRAIPTPALATAWGVRLESVSCVSTTRCVAVGWQYDTSNEVALAELWNGTSWSLLAMPSVASNARLSGVSCWGINGCLAVGSYSDTPGSEKAFSERWNGSTWTAVNTPSPTGVARSSLRGVSCVSVTRCVAVGDSVTTTSDRALIEAWTGTRWSIYAKAQPSGHLTSVSCSSSTVCMAVGVGYGTTTHALADLLNGTSWQVRATPTSIAALASVSCKSGHCESVGGLDGSPRIARWNGSAWKAQSAVYPSGWNALNAVSCSSLTACRAAGLDEVNGPPSDGQTGDDERSLYETLSGGSWTIMPAVDPAGAMGGHVDDISCASTVSCLAVGGSPFGFADTWNGSVWKPTSVPRPAHTAFSLEGVSCSSTTACMAVGLSYPSTGGPKALALRWNGSSWVVLSMPKLPYPAELRSVACLTATRCVAVGRTNTSVPLAMVWDGMAWTVKPTPSGGSDGLADVSCWSFVGCLAVGGGGLAETWNGTAWTRSTTPSGTGDLAGVSCPAVKTCVAVGTSTARWNGAAWTIGAVPQPSGGSGAVLHGVSCTSAASCVAVGGYCSYPSGCDPFPTFNRSLTASWDGASWTIRDTPVPSRAQWYAQTAVSCPSSTVCTSVGWAWRAWPVPYALQGS